MKAYMATQPVTHLSPDEYLALDELADRKSEYDNGEMFAMAGATFNHTVLAFELAALLGRQLDGTPCRGLTSDMRVHVPATNLYAYPDLTVVCGPPRMERNTLLNPTLIVEIVSPATEGYDRGRKFDHYQTIDSLAQYVTVAQDRVQVLLHTRTPEGHWLLTSATRRGDTVELVSIGCAIPVGKLYQAVQFEGD